MRCTLRRVEVWNKYGEQDHAAEMINLAIGSGWIHMNERTQKDMMRRWERVERGEPGRPPLPAGLDLSKLPPKAQAVYRAWYHVPKEG